MELLLLLFPPILAPLKPFTAVASGTVATTAVCSVLVLVGFEKARRFDIHLIIDLSRVDELCLRMTGRGLSDPLLPRCLCPRFPSAAAPGAAVPQLPILLRPFPMPRLIPPL